MDSRFIYWLSSTSPLGGLRSQHNLKMLQIKVWNSCPKPAPHIAPHLKLRQLHSPSCRANQCWHNPDCSHSPITPYVIPQKPSWLPAKFYSESNYVFLPPTIISLDSCHPLLNNVSNLASSQPTLSSNQADPTNLDCGDALLQTLLRLPFKYTPVSGPLLLLFPLLRTLLSQTSRGLIYRIFPFSVQMYPYQQSPPWSPYMEVKPLALPTCHPKSHLPYQIFPQSTLCHLKKHVFFNCMSPVIVSKRETLWGQEFLFICSLL